MKKLTKKQQELVDALWEVAETSDGDPEGAHDQADTILLKIIDNPRVTKAFSAVKKWYA